MHTPQPTRPLALLRPLWALLALLPALLAGCGSPGPGPTDLGSIREVSWEVERIGETEPLPQTRLTMRVAGIAGVTGNTGVNNFSARSGPATGGFWKLAPLTLTRRAGPPEFMEQERLYLQHLAAGDRWYVRGGKLYVLRGDEVLVRFGKID